MKIYILYSFLLHTFIFSLILFAGIKSNNMQNRIYYIDFVGKSEIITPQNNINIKNAIKQKKEIKEKTEDFNTKKDNLKKQKEEIKQIEDPDYLYTNIKPSMIDEEPEILNEKSNSNTVNSENNSTAVSHSGGITTDKEFPYPWYITKLREKLWDVWQKKPTGNTNLSAVVKFIITRNGTIKNIKIEKSSGNDSFDKMALSAVFEIEKFEPLPDDFFESYLTVYVEFKIGR